MSYHIKRFRFGKDEQEWNEFVKNAQNATFLFDRNFMDYHSNRFVDHSLMVYNEKDHLIACFPAHESENDQIASHKGLTYGSFILQQGLKLPVVTSIYKSILEYFYNEGFQSILYKRFPRFYNDHQTEEIEYCLFLSDAVIFRRDTAIAVDRNNRIKYSGNIKREAKKASSEHDVEINEDNDFAGFWKKSLIPNLQERFGVKPVHSIEEILLLKKSFPDNIHLFTARKKGDEEILAGTVMFCTNNVAHCQYIAASDKGRDCGALNLLFVTLLDEYYQNQRYFDFGIVNENNGKNLNKGLLAWKERMGGRTYSHDFYWIKPEKHFNLV